MPPSWSRLARPWLVDLAIVAVLAPPAIAAGIREGDGHAGVGALAVVVVLPLLWRRQRPLAAFAAVLALGSALPVTGAYLVPALVALYTVATRRPWPLAAACGAVLVAVLTAHDLAWSGSAGSAQTVVATAMSGCAVVALGLYVATRRAHLAGLRERAERLERERELLAARAVADERVRIAQELHDVVGHNVALMVVQAQALGATEGSAAVREATDAIAGLGRATMAEMHRTLRLLRGGGDDDGAARGPQPGLRGVDDLVGRAREAGVPVTLTVEGTPRPLPAGVDLSAYRIVQEALTNVVKHARGAPTDVLVRYEAGAVELVIADDGATPVAAGAGAGHGLIGMRERVALYGGTLHAGARNGHGFEVRARLPAAGAGP